MSHGFDICFIRQLVKQLARLVQAARFFGLLPAVSSLTREGALIGIELLSKVMGDTVLAKPTS